MVYDIMGVTAKQKRERMGDNMDNMEYMITDKWFADGTYTLLSSIQCIDVDGFGIVTATKTFDYGDDDDIDYICVGDYIALPDNPKRGDIVMVSHRDTTT